MPSGNITSLTALAVMQPSMLMYAGISPFGATDDRKITAGDLLTTIAPLNAGTQALTVTANPVPTVPTIEFNSATGGTRIQFDPSNNLSLTDTFDALSIFSNAGSDLGIGVWNALDTGNVAQWFLYAGATGTDFLRGISQGGGGANTSLLRVPHSGVLMTSNTTTGGLILLTDVAAPIIFATGGDAFTNEKGRFDAAGFTLGKASSVTGALNLANSASANLTTIQAGNAAAARTYVWPTDFGAAGDVLTDAAGDGVLSWAAGGGGSGTVNSGTQYQMAYYAANGTAVSGNTGIVTDANNHLNITPSDGTPSTLRINHSDGIQRAQIGLLASNYGAIWLGDVTSPGTSNYTLGGNGNSETILNVGDSSGGIALRANNGSSPNIMTASATHVGIFNNGPSGGLHVTAPSSATVSLVAQGATSQSANLQDWTDASNNVLASVLNTGAFSPASLADSSAANNTLYFSTDAGKLVYKDSGGVVNNLY